METDSRTGKQQRVLRQIAVKASIRAIKKGSFVAKEGWEPHVVQSDGFEAARVNLIGVIVAKQTQNPMLSYGHAVIDDGSDTIVLRSFSDAHAFAGIAVGDACLVIGRPREYGKEIYIVPEIVRRLGDPAWLSLRTLELAIIEQQRRRITNLGSEHPATPLPVLQKKENHEEPLRPDGSGAGASVNPEGPRIFGEVDVLHIIRGLDDGSGVAIDALIDACKNAAAEEIVRVLLRKGDIFEIRPGTIKILE